MMLEHTHTHTHITFGMRNIGFVVRGGKIKYKTFTERKKKYTDVGSTVGEACD